MASLWRKQVLPHGTFPWGGRELAFTPAYLDGLVAAFDAGAVDLVLFSLGDRSGGSSYDPALACGFARSIEHVADGLDALVEVDAAGDARLEKLAKADPGSIETGVRIIERYRTTDGREFPVVLAMIYTTSAPAFTGLRPWERVSGGG